MCRFLILASVIALLSACGGYSGYSFSADPEAAAVEKATLDYHCNLDKYKVLYDSSFSACVADTHIEVTQLIGNGAVVSISFLTPHPDHDQPMGVELHKNDFGDWDVIPHALHRNDAQSY